ncbi:uncharacterized protein LOC143288343 isoform X2 [Babylonia areolata]|uniref:uncharacterized protein LOC143288343 isoform X2 n=1 Tax=Babylonia areolata TaxID=304850 RepID=UPI003FD5D5A5
MANEICPTGQYCGTRRKRPPLTRDGSHPRTAATRPSSASHWVRTARLVIDLASETERPTFETLIVRPMAASLAALSAKSLPGVLWTNEERD